MEHRPTHDEDVFAWSQHQAAVLRGLAARRGRPNDLDLDHLAEEIEDLGRDALLAVPAACPLTLGALLDEAFDGARTVAVPHAIPCA
ncbi:DUF29 family protein [Azospirillum sp. ST 5-10]|uniref:DUF29 family protein n=1 Tax=unclassified Azospirillum TaxID=2630922 RepID=UPI003F49D74F